MKSDFSLVKLTFCAPADVANELEAAKGVVTEWNLAHGESRGFWVKFQHWSTDGVPDLSERPQAVLNRQIIDDSDILVSVLWSRLGTPTGRAESGTQEEIERGIDRGKKVLVYFSKLEPLPATAEDEQLQKLALFKARLTPSGLTWSFNSRAEFKELFSRHLAKVLNQFDAIAKATGQVKQPSVRQKAKGNGNVQIAGSVGTFNHYQKPPKIKKVIERREGSLTSEECREVQNMIKALVDLTTGMTTGAAFAMWWERFKKNFALEKYEELPSARMEDARKWYRAVAGIEKRKHKTRAPARWQGERITAIKSVMSSLGRKKEDYYPEISRRLKMKKPFVSLKDLTKTDLERVYNLVLRDAHQ